MNVASMGFLVAFLALATVFYVLPGTRLRQIALAIANGGFLAATTTSLPSLAAMAGFLLSGYGIALILRARPDRTIFATYVFLLVASFVYLRHYEFLGLVLPEPWLHHPLAIIGLSYMLFRQIGE